MRTQVISLVKTTTRTATVTVTITDDIQSNEGVTRIAEAKANLSHAWSMAETDVRITDLYTLETIPPDAKAVYR